MTDRVYVVGTADTKGAELRYVRDAVIAAGVPAVVVDVSTGRAVDAVDIPAAEVAASHPDGADAVATGERGTAIEAMARALTRYLLRQEDLGGVIALGGSGGTSLACTALRALPIGLPKLMVSTVAAGNVAPYVGASDITMMYSVTDIAGLNPISRVILANAAHAIAGMVSAPPPATVAADRPALGLTMFGVTTPCVTAVSEALEEEYDCLVFHATGTGGRSMEKLALSGMLSGILDISTTEVCDLLLGGIMPASEDRLACLAASGLPYLGSCGALDMVNFGARDSVPDRYKGRLLHEHNAQITLMRTTPEESRRIGAWIGERLNRFRGPVCFLLPEGGISALDAPGMPFHSPEADRALFASLEASIEQTGTRRVLRVPHHINSPEFADAVVAEFRALTTGGSRASN